jgi:hypothetical protein
LIDVGRRTCGAVLTSACGWPEFQDSRPPQSPATLRKRHTTEAAPGIPGGQSQHFVTGPKFRPNGGLYSLEALNALIEQALAAVPI